MGNYDKKTTSFTDFPNHEMHIETCVRHRWVSWKKNTFHPSSSINSSLATWRGQKKIKIKNGSHKEILYLLGLSVYVLIVL